MLELNSDTDNETPFVVEEKMVMSEKGQRMAKSIGQYLLNRYFFGDMKDLRKMNYIKSLFMEDMQFDLNTGKVSKLHERLGPKLAQQII